MAAGFTKAFKASVADNPQKGLMVAMAVGHQLAVDGHPPPVDTSKVMGADYQYNPASMKGFLDAVQDGLAKGNPAYTFTFPGGFVAKALKMRVGVLTGAINDQTV
jgi:hypothetical protein